MKKKALLFVAVLTLFAIMTSCAASDVAAFQSGFRDGWNSTAPSEYRY